MKSLKAGRRLTLFGRAAFDLWIQLETDPRITALCERPLLISEADPRCIVDFWARDGDRDLLIFLARELGPALRKKREDRLIAFRMWAATAGCVIEEREPVALTPAREIWLDNWVGILQQCSSYRASITPAALDHACRAIVGPTALGKLAASLAAGDASKLAGWRATVLELVRCGRASIPSLASSRRSDVDLVQPEGD